MRVKKILAGFLSAAMIFSMIPTTAFATEPDDSGNTTGTGTPAAEEHEHDFETNEPVLSEDGTKLIYTCAVEGCEETREEDYVADTPSVASENGDSDTNDGSASPQDVDETTYVAQIGDTKYETLAKAVESVTDEVETTITLLANITEDIVISKNQNVRLDLGNYELTNQTGDTITNNGTLTISGTGTVKNTVHGKTALNNNGTAHLKGGKFLREDVADNSYYTVLNHGTMTIEGTEITNTGIYASCLENGWYDDSDVNGEAKLTIVSGTVSGGLNAVKNDAGGVLDIQGGTVTNSTQYAIMNWHKAEISGGEITCTAAQSNKIYPAAIYNQSGENADNSAGQLTISGGNITTTQSSTYALDNRANATICGTAKLMGGSSAVQSKGAAAITDISGGTLVGTKYYAVTASDGSNVEISGGVLSASYNVVRASNSGTEIIITDGTFTNAAGKATIYVGIGTKVDISGGEFSGSTAYAVNNNGGQLIISDGKFSSADSAVYVKNTETAVTAISGGSFETTTDEKNAVTVGAKGTLVVSGGTFSSDVSEYVPDGYEYDSDTKTVTSKGAASITDSSGAVTYYPTLQDAVNAAAEGQTVKLVTNVTEDSTIAEGQNITLDLNGKTLTNVSSHTIINNGTLAITDTGTGTIGTVDNVTHAKAAIYNYGTLKVENGIFTRSKEEPYTKDTDGKNSWYTVVNVGTITEISGGMFRTGDGTAATLGNLSSLIRNGDGTNPGTIQLISGGSFISAANVIKNEPNSTISSITGGTFTMDNTVNLFYGGNNILQNTGTIDSITGGTFKAIGSGQDLRDGTTYKRYGIFSSGTITELGGNTVLDMMGDNNYGLAVTDTGTVTVTGGTYSVSDDKDTAENAQSHLIRTGSSAVLKISGGTFSEPVSVKYCADGYIPITSDSKGTYTVDNGEGNYVAAILNTDGTYTGYETLADAFANAQSGDIVTLLTDIYLTETVTVSEAQNIVLDLNGKNITVFKNESTGRSLYAIDNKGTFTLKDSTGNGCITARGIENLENGQMTIESGKIISCDSNGGACIWNEADLTINGGTFETIHVGSPGDNVGVGCLNNQGTALITGGTFTDVNRRTYAIISTGEIEITPAEGTDVNVHGAHGGLAIDSGTAVVNGGNYSSDDYYGLYVSNDGLGVDPMKAAVTVNGGTFTGKSYSVCIGSDYNNPVNSTITITNGTFEKPLNAQECTREGAIVISGGQFSEQVEDKWCAEGYVPTTEKDQNGTYTVKTDEVARIGTTIYSTLAEAMEAAQNGDTVTLLKDVALKTAVVVSGKKVTLDLNNCNITRGDGNTTSYLIGVASDGTLTVTDTSADKNGKIHSENFTVTEGDEEVTYAGYGIQSNGSLTIAGGIVSGYYGVYSSNVKSGGTASLTITGGTVKGTQIGVYVGNNTAGTAKFIMTGGSVNSSWGIAAANLSADGILEMDISGGSVLANNAAIEVNANKAPLTEGETLEQKASYPVKLTVSDNAEISGKYGVTLWGKGAELTVEGGTIKGEDFGISGNGTYSTSQNNSGTIINVKGGVIETTGETGTGIYHPQYGTMDISGGRITGATGIEIRAGELTVSGDASIAGTGTPLETEGNGNGTTTFGAGIGVVQHTTKLPIAVNISGGTIEGYVALNEANVQGNSEEDIAKVEIAISGGSFTATNKEEGAQAISSEDCTGFVSGGSFSSKVLENYCAAGYQPTEQQTNGTYSVEVKSLDIATVTSDGSTITYRYGRDAYYDTAIAALNAAWKAAQEAESATVTLLMDVDLGDTSLSMNKGNIVLMMDEGVTLSSEHTTNTTTSNGVVEVWGGSLTLRSGIIKGTTYYGAFASGRNGNENVTLTVENGVTISGTFGVYAEKGATANIQGGAITGTDYGVAVHEGTVNISGGTITGVYYGVRVSNGTGTTISTVNITDGAIKATGEDGIGVCVHSKGLVDISGGTIASSNNIGLLVVGGAANVSGGKISGLSQGSVVDQGGTLTVSANAELSSSPIGVYVVNGIANISGGTIAGTTCGVMMAKAETANANISGGTIIGTNSQNSFGLYAQDNSVVTLTGGTFTGSTCSVCRNSTLVSALLEEGYGYYDSSNALISSTNTNGLTAANGYGTVTVAKNATYASMYGATLTLDGTIGVNFYLDMSGVEEAEWSNYSMKFMVNGEESTVLFDVNACRIIGEKTYYRFTCPVAAKQMADTITASLYCGNTWVKTVNYSVMQYCNNRIQANSRGDSVALFKAMLNYGSYAQSYFKYFEDNLANANLDESDKSVENVTVNDLQKYESTAEGDIPNGMNIGASLILESSTTIRFHIEGTTDNYTFMLDDVKVDLTECTDGGYYVEIPNINVQYLHVPHTLTVVDSNGTEAYSISYSALSYAYNMVKDTGKEENIKNLARAMYLYHEAAEKYTSWLQN